MTSHAPQRWLVVTACLLALGSAHALTKDEAKVQKDRIEADYKAAHSACEQQSGNDKDVCISDARGQRDVARAELEYNRTGKASDADKLAKTRAKTAYNTAKQKCDALKGNDKDVCMKEAKAAETRAMADAKTHKETREARKEANEDIAEANYKVAKEKCDAMSGNAQDACLQEVKARFHK
jgi:hypothetical protein